MLGPRCLLKPPSKVFDYQLHCPNVNRKVRPKLSKYQSPQFCKRTFLLPSAVTFPSSSPSKLTMSVRGVGYTGVKTLWYALLLNFRRFDGKICEYNAVITASVWLLSSFYMTILPTNMGLEKFATRNLFFCTSSWTSFDANGPEDKVAFGEFTVNRGNMLYSMSTPIIHNLGRAQGCSRSYRIPHLIGTSE